MYGNIKENIVSNLTLDTEGEDRAPTAVTVCGPGPRVECLVCLLARLWSGLSL